MRRWISYAHKGLAWMIVAAVVLQFLFAGVGVFGANSFEAHIGPGYLIALAVLLLLMLALVGWLGAARIGLSALLVVLVVVQIGLIWARDFTPYVSALHPENALLVLGAAHEAARRSAAVPVAERQRVEDPVPTDRTAARV